MNTHSQGDTLTIHNQGSNNSHEFYQMHSHFLVTYRYCSGAGENDYINSITLSETDQVLYQDYYAEHLTEFKSHMTHFHDYFELLIVLEGSITQRIEDREYRYDAGSCCLITRSLCHLELLSEDTQILFIGFSVPYIQSLFSSVDNSPFATEKGILSSTLYNFIMKDINKPGQKAYLDFIPTMANIGGRRWLHSYAEEIVRTLLSPGFGAEHLLKGLFGEVLGYLSTPDCYHCTLTSLDQSSDFLIFSRVEHILQENHGRVSRSELASILSYSGDYINRIVNKYTGMCLSDYSLGFSLDEAASRLRTTDASIARITEDLGFTNRTYFYRIFQNKFGCTPKEYRKKQGLNPAYKGSIIPQWFNVKPVGFSV